jgi:ribosomal protein S27AE
MFLANHGSKLKSLNEKGVPRMMKKAVAKKSIVYTVDLTKIDGDGAFPCPKCGTVISPDDETDQVYQIVETKVKGDALSELILVCSKCGSSIKLVGFLSRSESQTN